MANNSLSIGFFFAFMVLTLLITYWAARRTRTTEHFFAAGGKITAWQNGWALAGDFLGADVAHDRLDRGEAVTTSPDARASRSRRRFPSSPVWSRWQCSLPSDAAAENSRPDCLRGPSRWWIEDPRR